MDSWLAARFWAWLGLGWSGLGYDSHFIYKKKKPIILFSLHLLLPLRPEQQSTPKSSTPKNCSATPEPGQSRRPGKGLETNKYKVEISAYAAIVQEMDQRFPDAPDLAQKKRCLAAAIAYCGPGKGELRVKDV